jgi:4-hydroxy-3-polyprenylbenzoate decarboxylase
MAFSGLTPFINALEANNELLRISTFVDPVLEITEVADRVAKKGGKALLFEDTGTRFPLLINAFGSESRLAMALGLENIEAAGREIENLFNLVTANHDGFISKILSAPKLLRLASLLPSKISRRGSCQQIVHNNPDLGILPVLKCWPFDGGRFITLPMVHTIHPLTGKTNVGMYRMQILDKNTTGMHWQRHKTGANHFEAWKKEGRRMPVSVALGGDPVYTYAATAPLPENINEYILAGFLRKKKVSMVKCITNEIFVPSDADIVIEGYVDPSEEFVTEGPFGDHTGFYSLADLYPKFHVTCITHSKNAVYPATIVGVPPQEDAFFAKASENIFLSPVKISMLPEVVDFHMPDAGTAHNLMVVRISKSYPGQGMKVISSMSGAGQMMFSKYIIVVSGEVDIRNYNELLRHVFANCDPSRDILFGKGPLDVLDHSSDSFSFGGKAGIDATVKLPEELEGRSGQKIPGPLLPASLAGKLKESKFIKGFNLKFAENGFPLLITSLNPSEDNESIEKLGELLRNEVPKTGLKAVFAVDHTVDVEDLFMVSWQVLGNSDPVRDHEIISGSCILIDATIKVYSKRGFPRRWPNVVCTYEDTIRAIDQKWSSLEIGEFISSPSDKYRKLCRNGDEEIITGK